MKEGMPNATEVYAHGQHVGYDGIHAIYFQPLGVLFPTFIINDVVEQGHEQEAITATHQCHGACPDFFDDRMPDSPYLTDGNHATAYNKQIS